MSLSPDRGRPDRGLSYYPLTLPRANQLIVAMEAMTKYVVALPDFQDRVVKSMRMTHAERRADLEKDRRRWTSSRETA